MVSPIKPTSEQIAELKRQQASIPELRKEIEKAKKAGIDVAEQEKELNSLESKLKQLLAVYG